MALNSARSPENISGYLKRNKTPLPPKGGIVTTRFETIIINHATPAWFFNSHLGVRGFFFVTYTHEPPTHIQPPQTKSNCRFGNCSHIRTFMATKIIVKPKIRPMKKLLFLLLLLPALAFSQNCKFERNETDKFTNAKVVITKEEIAWKNPMGGNSLSFKLQNIDGKLSMWFRYSMSKTFSIQQGSKLMLLTPSGTIELLAAETKVSDHYSSTSFIEIIYTITPEAYTLMLSSPVTDVRFYTTDGFIEHTLKENKQAIFLTTAACIK